jgi:hypothetical protein
MMRTTLTTLTTLSALAMTPVAWAAQGTLEVAVVRPDSTACTADVEVRKAGSATVLKKFPAVGGSGVAQLEAGDYEVKAACRVGGQVGTVKASIKRGAIAHYRVATKAASTPPPDLGSGKLHVVAGSSPKLATGHVRVLAGGREIGRSKVASNKFAVYDLKPGDYTLQLFDAKGKKIVEKKVTVKPQAVTLSP